MAVNIRLPRLLDSDMQEKARLHPTRVSLMLEMEPLSTADMTLPRGEVAVQTGDFIELFLPGRSAGIFRAAQVTRDYVNGSQSIRLEHGLVTLGDYVIPGRHEFVGWDAGELRVTGFGATCYRSNVTGGWNSASLTIRNNSDGRKVNYVFGCGVVMPVIARTEAGWIVHVTQELLALASSGSSAAWDRETPTGLIPTDALTACTPYSNAHGMTKENTITYHRPAAVTSYEWGSIYAATPVTVHGRTDLADSYGRKHSMYAISYINSIGQTLHCFVRAEDVTLEPGYIVDSAAAEQENHMKQVADALMGLTHQKQTQWEFGASDFDESFGYVFENVNLLKALLSLPGRLKGQYQWTFDQRTLPWRLNLRRLDREDLAELRLNRNLTKLSISMDRSRLATCVLPIGKDGCTVTQINDGSPYVSAENIGTYGHVEALLQTMDADAQTLYESALDYLREYSQIAVSVTVSALDLSAMTGEPLDRLTLGKLCRVPLPEEGVVVNEYITRLVWKDVYGAPEQVTVTLANPPEMASDLLARLMRGG